MFKVLDRGPDMYYDKWELAVVFLEAYDQLDQPFEASNWRKGRPRPGEPRRAMWSPMSKTSRGLGKTPGIVSTKHAATSGSGRCHSAFPNKVCRSADQAS